MNQYLQEAEQIKDTIVADRRQIHQNPEVGIELYTTTEYIMKRLKEMGYEPKEICKSGVMASVGKKGGKTILLRADTDALPMQEDSGLAFQSKNSCAAHTCGHDMHAAMLLGAAKLLKEHESELNGEVRLMFQPDEEALTGAKAMIEAGILEGVDNALALHVMSGKMAPGNVVTAPGVVAASQDRFVIEVTGTGTHGAMPHLGVDPITVGAHILLGLQELIARELDSTTPVVITVGSFQAGDAANIIPQKAVLQGTIRSLSIESRSFAKQRLVEIAELTAKTYRAECSVSFPVETPCNYNNPEFTKQITGYLEEMNIPVIPAPMGMGSEDFAYVAEQVPSTILIVAAGGEEEKYHYPMHNPKIQFNEDVLPYGTAILVNCAIEVLKG